MNDGSSESHAERVNEELREYKGFLDILSLLQRTADDPGLRLTWQQLSADQVSAMKRTPDEERAAKEAAFSALIAHPEIAALVRRLQEFDAERGSLALRALFPSSTAENSQEK